MIFERIPNQRRITTSTNIFLPRLLSLVPLCFGCLLLVFYVVPNALSSQHNSQNTTAMAYNSDYRALSFENNSQPYRVRVEVEPALWNCEGNYTDRPESFEFCLQVASSTSQALDRKTRPINASR